MAAQTVSRVTVDGDVLEYISAGSGEPVLLIHGALIADALTPLQHEARLTDRYRLVSIRRRGFAGSTHPARSLTLTEQAAECRGLMRALGISRAHVVGHSYGGAIALQMALDSPAAVQSLVLLEAALLGVPSGPLFLQAMGPVVGLYQTGDKAGAVDAFLAAVVGPEYRAALDQTVPGGYDQAVTDADTWFAKEMTALVEWAFTLEDARRVAQPALAIIGANSAALWPGWKEGHDRLREWLPQASGFVLPNATHGLQMQHPRDVAEEMAAFLARHPIAARPRL